MAIIRKEQGFYNKQMSVDTFSIFGYNLMADEKVRCPVHLIYGINDEFSPLEYGVDI